MDSVIRMVNIPAEILEAMSAPATVKALVTADAAGKPHAIVCGSIVSPQPDKMVVGEILMHRSAANLAENPSAAFLISAGKDAWEIAVENAVRIAEGPMLEGMNEKLATMNLHANALWIFDVAAVYEQGANPKAGTKIA